MAMSRSRQHLVLELLVTVLFVREVNLWPVLSLADLWGSKRAESLDLLPGNATEEGLWGDGRYLKALNFFPIPVSEECLSDDGRRTGVCMNTYECRIQNGDSHGGCALGFGVCCIFTATCDKDIENDDTYFVNPEFPGLTRDSGVCTVRVKKTSPLISQLRLDFVHFNLGQPNRRTGVCEMDTFVMSGGTSKELKLCGQNSGHHVYYDVENVKEPITITMNLTRENMNRMWEIKITQIEFNQRAPAGCMQYYTEPSGVIQTMNFAENGRHLADQDYNICMRQAPKMCSIVYEPCDENSFKIGPPYQPHSNRPIVYSRPLSVSQSATPAQTGGVYGVGDSNGGLNSVVVNAASTNTGGVLSDGSNAVGANTDSGGFDLVNALSGMIEFDGGSGDGAIADSNRPSNGDASRPLNDGSNRPLDDGPNRPLNIGSNRPLNSGSNGPLSGSASNIVSNTVVPNVGANSGSNSGYTRPLLLSYVDTRECEDRIVMPCDSEEFIMADTGGPGVCDLLHCGSSFCSDGEMPCRIESSTTPFNIRVQFGPGTRDESPDDNLGMCLKYEQQPCGA